MNTDTNRDATIASASSSNKPGTKYGWIVFLVTLVLLVLGAITILIVYNLSQLLTLETLHSARQRWQARGPSNFRMEFVVKRNGQADSEVAFAEEGRYIVRVREGRVRYVSRNGVALLPETYDQFRMDSIFAHLTELLERDVREDTPTSFTRAIFHHRDGHLQWYVRRVSRTRNRIEIIMNEYEIEH